MRLKDILTIFWSKKTKEGPIKYKNLRKILNIDKLILSKSFHANNKVYENNVWLCFTQVKLQVKVT